MRLIKTRLKNRLGEDSLDQTMQMCIEGPSENMLELIIIDNWKEKKTRKLISILYVKFIITEKFGGGGGAGVFGGHTHNIDHTYQNQ